MDEEEEEGGTQEEDPGEEVGDSQGENGPVCAFGQAFVQGQAGDKILTHPIRGYAEQGRCMVDFVKSRLKRTDNSKEKITQLLHQATDETLLSKMYEGWMAWL